MQMCILLNLLPANENEERSLVMCTRALNAPEDKVEEPGQKWCVTEDENMANKWQGWSREQNEGCHITKTCAARHLCISFQILWSLICQTDIYIFLSGQCPTLVQWNQFKMPIFLYAVGNSCDAMLGNDKIWDSDMRSHWKQGETEHTSNEQCTLKYCGV